MFVIKDFFYWGKMTQPAFVDLLNFADYEILNEYPFTIRRKDNHHELNESDSTGYITVTLNGKKYAKHRLIAEQFLPNPYDYPEVAHLNHNKTDNHLSNLRWVSRSQSILNSTSFRGVAAARYVDEIDPEAMVCDYYDTKTERHYFTDYYYHEGTFYYDTDINYRILNVNSTGWGAQYVNMRDTEGKQVKVVVARFLEQHDML